MNSPSQFPQRLVRMLKAVPFLAAFCVAACAIPPSETVALQCITGSAEWSPLVLDFAQSRVGSNPATITESQIRWETINRNGFGGAAYTQYAIDRSSGTVTVDNTYVDSHGNRATARNRYVGECYPRHRPL